MNDKLKDFYKSYPDLFMKDCYGIELSPFQKVIMRKLLNNKKNENFLVVPSRCGQTYYRIISEMIKILYCKEG